MIRGIPAWPACLIALVLAGCATTHHPRYSESDPGSIPNAVPRDVPLSRYGNPASYRAVGKTYYVLKSAAGFTQTGIASWYGKKFHGKRTSSHEPYNMYAMTAAHKTLPIPTWVRVTNLENHRQAIVKINDRGPFSSGRIIDLSYLAALKLGIVGHGTARVRIQTVTPETLNQPATSPAPRRSYAERRSQPGQSRPDSSTVSTQPSLRDVNSQPTGPMLQVGAFADPAHAALAQTRAAHSTARPVSVIPPSSGQTLYRVWVGPFTSANDLATAEKQLTDAGLPVRKINR